MSKTKPAAAKPAAPRPLSGAALKATQARAAKAAAVVTAHEAVVLTCDFETHLDGPRVFRAGQHHLPPHLAAEARKRGLVATDAG